MTTLNTLPTFLILAFIAVLGLGVAVSASSAAISSLIRSKLPGQHFDFDPDPVQVIGILHGMMLVGWIGVVYYFMGLLIAALFAAAGLTLMLPNVRREIGSVLLQRFGPDRFSRTSLFAEAATTIAFVFIYAVVLRV
jgi:hypothetical protein